MDCVLDIRGSVRLAAAWGIAAALLLLAAFPGRAADRGELVFGMSAPFTGANGELGIEFYRGFMAYIDFINVEGGVEGWKLRVTPANDGYNPGPCFCNTAEFIEGNVFALFSYVGTPNTAAVLPLLEKFESRDMFLLFPFTGAMPMRSPPYGKYVYNLRASYFDETRAMVDRFTDLGLTRISVFYQNDAYGRTGWDGVRRALRTHGLEMASEAAYQRGASFSEDFGEQARLILDGDPDVIVCIGTYASQGAFVRDARNAGFDGLIAGVSFADSDKMLDLLDTEERRTGRNYTRNLFNTQVVPCYERTDLPGAALYRKLMDRYKGLPMTPGDGYSRRRFSYVSFEGFLNGMLLVEVVRRMADDPRRERIPEVMASIREYDLGIGVNANFGNGRHQGLDRVYFTTAEDGHFAPVRDWERWRK